MIRNPMHAFAALAIVALAAQAALAGPTLKGPLDGQLTFDPGGSGAAVLIAEGHLTLMGKVIVYGEFVFEPRDGGEPGDLDGIGVAFIVAANGDILVANVVAAIDADGSGRMEWRWPGAITLGDGTVIESTGRFVELPFAGLKLILITEFQNVKMRMTGEIVDPDPID